MRITHIRHTVRGRYLKSKCSLASILKTSAPISQYCWNQELRSIFTLLNGRTDYYITKCSPTMRTKQLNSRGSESLLYKSRANPECKAVDSFKAKRTLLSYSWSYVCESTRTSRRFKFLVFTFGLQQLTSQKKESFPRSCFGLETGYLSRGWILVLFKCGEKKKSVHLLVVQGHSVAWCSWME